MSSNFIPMLPSTPPPLDATVESDDDEFGSFSVAFGQYDDSQVGIQENSHTETETKIDKSNCSNHYVNSQNDVNIQKREIHVSNSYNHFPHFSNESVSSDNEDIYPSIEDKTCEKTVELQNEKNGRLDKNETKMPSNIQTNKMDKYFLDASESQSPTKSPITIQMTICHSKEKTSDNDKEYSDGNTVTIIERETNSQAESTFCDDQEKIEVDETYLLTKNEMHPTDRLQNESIETENSEEKITIMETCASETKVILNRTEMSSQQLSLEIDKKEQTTLSLGLPIIPKNPAFQQKSDGENFESSPISVSDNFISVSDVSSELSNFETAKSSPSSFDICDKQQTSDSSESSNCLPDDGQTKDDNLSSQITQLNHKDSTDENSCDSVSSPVLKENAPIERDSVDNVDDEFADFQQAIKDNCVLPSSTSNVDILDSTEDCCSANNFNADSDDFEDFRCATSVEDDFANFESDYTEVTDDFADFEHAAFNKDGISEEAHENKFSSLQVSDKTQNKIAQLLHTTFPIIHKKKISDVSDAEESFPFINKIDDTTTLLRGRSKRLWDRLQDLDTTPAMLFRWGSSQCFQNMLHSLNIDSYSILRNTSVPIYASSLGLLEPTKGPAQSPKQQTTESKHIFVQESVPPAQFDWNDSGLVNPLDTSQIPSLLDLDFFVTQNNSLSTTSNTTNSGLEEELLGPSTAHKSNGNNRSPLIKQILASTKSTIFPPAQKHCVRPADLSEEVVRVLDKLPDLSFMQAKVLMFPVNSLSEN